MIARIDQQILVTRLLIDAHDLGALQKTNRKLAGYMYRYLARLMRNCTMHLWLSDDREKLRKADMLWDEIKWSRPALYRRLRYMSRNLSILPGQLGRKINLRVYRRLKKKRGIH